MRDAERRPLQFPSSYLLQQSQTSCPTIVVAAQLVLELDYHSPHCRKQTIHLGNGNSLPQAASSAYVILGGIAYTQCIDASRGAVVNFDLGERFPRPRSQQRGSLRPAHGV